MHDWAQTFERYWTHQLDHIKNQAERKAMERLPEKRRPGQSREENS